MNWHNVIRNSNHSLITITPDNQAKYAKDDRFSNTDRSGNRYATLGAGPNGWGNLVAGINRPSDAELHSGGIHIKAPLKYKNEDSFISSLFELQSNYDNDLDYDLFPSSEADSSWFVADDGYNSNSYVSGLLRAAGAIPPQPHATAPGFDKPVPPENFERKEQ